MDSLKLIKLLNLKFSFLTTLWFTLFFTILCLGVYEWGVFRKEKLRRYLENKIVTLHGEREREKKLNFQLEEQLKAQSDPAWVELLLRKKLGVVKVGEKKIVFKSVD